MERYHRAQVLLRPEQYERLQEMARARSARRGKRVSVSQVIRDILDQSLMDEQRRWQRAQDALDDLLALGDTVQARWQEEMPEEWFTNMREERADALYRELSDGH